MPSIWRRYVSKSMSHRGQTDSMRETVDWVLDMQAVGEHMGVVILSDQVRMHLDVVLKTTEENIQTVKS